MSRRRNKPLAPQPIQTAIVESLDHEGRGVTHVDGKTIFIEGALPFEKVTFQSHKIKSSYESADLVSILKASNQRVTPQCQYFGYCGGCAMQHMEFNAQVAAKQRMLEDNLWHIGRVRAQNVLPPLIGTPWNYRHKARLRVRHVPKKGGVLVGFNEKTSSYVADMDSCQVLPKHVSDLIPKLKLLIAELTVRETLPQIELAVGENDVTVLVLRILQGLQPGDLPLLKVFADEHNVQIWTQTKGPDTVMPLYPAQPAPLQYTLLEYDLKYPFSPTEFTQVNPAINRVMIRRAMQLLAPKADERIADFFCGLGNFTLPIARSGAKVIGLEGASGLVRRAVENATLNGLQVEFGQADLFEMTPEKLQALGYFDKWLIDPPRDGAVELVKALPDDGQGAPKRIVYVSCNPSTLARDAQVLTQVKGYTLVSAGVMNMFPHTGHVESIALFEHAV